MTSVVPHPGRTLIIGDVHGCADELEDLLKACDHQPRDRVVFVGDLVAKGPQSAQTVARARQLRALGVRGNHDQHCLAWWHAKRRGGTLPPLKPTHQQVCDTLSDADWRWLDALPYYLHFSELKTWVVHAGFVPGRAPEDQEERDMLYMRSIAEDGSVSKRVDEGQPWASRWFGPEHVVFGHDAIRGLQEYAHAVGIDTGCVYGGRLTAWILPERRLVSVPARRAWAAKNGE